MISHSPFTVESQTDLVGHFAVAGIQGEFEVRKLRSRRERPRIMVFRQDWQRAKPGDAVPPVAVIQIEKNGVNKLTVQTGEWSDLRDCQFNFTEQALEIFRTSVRHAN
ncbi:hypothetical protein PUG42_25115 [Erwiniaceae bacterium L1_54_3]|nr:hypothetical protein [Erwiniaceae bacterium L1_54_3]